jgi:hypothetical protein
MRRRHDDGPSSTVSKSSLKTSPFVANYTSTFNVLFEVKENAVINAHVMIRLG